MYRTYILRLKPNKTQTKLLDKTISCVQKFDDIYFAQIKDTKIKSHREMLSIARNTDEDLIFKKIDFLDVLPWFRVLIPYLNIYFYSLNKNTLNEGLGLNPCYLNEKTLLNGVFRTKW